ncbi:MAG: hypothetical protein AAF458_07130 [Pseudomonadota bacterium]
MMTISSARTSVAPADHSGSLWRWPLRLIASGYRRFEAARERERAIAYVQRMSAREAADLGTTRERLLFELEHGSNRGETSTQSPEAKS